MPDGRFPLYRFPIRAICCALQNQGQSVGPGIALVAVVLPGLGAGDARRLGVGDCGLGVVRVGLIADHIAAAAGGRPQGNPAAVCHRGISVCLQSVVVIQISARVIFRQVLKGRAPAVFAVQRRRPVVAGVHLVQRHTVAIDRTHRTGIGGAVQPDGHLMGYRCGWVPLLLHTKAPNLGVVEGVRGFSAAERLDGLGNLYPLAVSRQLFDHLIGDRLAFDGAREVLPNDCPIVTLIGNLHRVTDIVVRICPLCI